MLGTKYAMTNLSIYFSSKFFEDNKNNHITPRDTYYLMSLLDILFFSFLTLGIKLGNIIGPRPCIIISLIIQYFSFVLITFFRSNPYVVLISLGIFNIGNSISSLTSIKNCWKFFQNNFGMVFGFILSGSGISSSIFTFLGEYFIFKKFKDEEDIYKNDNYKDKKVDNELKLFLYIVAGVLIIFGILSFIISNEYKEEIFDADTLTDSQSGEEGSQDNISDYDVSKRESVKKNKYIKTELYNSIFSYQNLKLLCIGFFSFCKLII